MTNEEWLKDQCNRYTNGQCSTLSCLRRGGYKRGQVPVDYQLATCHAHEIVRKLELLDEINQDPEQ
jgi:hypothetical protein